jgi:hypothetical protein
LSRLPAGADPLDAAAAIGAIGGPITIVIAGGATVSGIAVGNARPERKPGYSVGLSFSYRIKASFFAPTSVDLGEAHGQYLMLFVHHAVKKGATAQKGKGGALA